MKKGIKIAGLLTGVGLAAAGLFGLICKGKDDDRVAVETCDYESDDCESEDDDTDE